MPGVSQLLAAPNSAATSFFSVRQKQRGTEQICQLLIAKQTVAEKRHGSPSYPRPRAHRRRRRRRRTKQHYDRAGPI
jgi:hypothetical protein